MRSTGMKRSSLMAALAIALAGAGAAVAQPVTLRDAVSGNNRRSYRPKRDTALQREIADHNAAVEARQAAKRDRRRGRG
jgi:hypothetical protein